MNIYNSYTKEVLDFITIKQTIQKIFVKLEIQYFCVCLDK